MSLRQLSQRITHSRFELDELLKEVDLVTSPWYRTKKNINLIPLDLVNLIKNYCKFIFLDIYDEKYIYIIHKKNKLIIKTKEIDDINNSIIVKNLISKKPVKLNDKLNIKINCYSNYNFEIGVGTPNILQSGTKCDCNLNSEYVHHKNYCYDQYLYLYNYHLPVSNIRNIRSTFTFSNNHSKILYKNDDYIMNKYGNFPKIKRNDNVSVQIKNNNLLFKINNKFIYEFKIERINFSKHFHFIVYFWCTTSTEFEIS